MHDYTEPLRPMTVIFDPLFEDVDAPTRGSELSAGYDLKAHIAGREIAVYPYRALTPRTVPVVTDVLVLEPGERALVPCGFKAQLPAGFEAQIRARSGLALKRGLVPINAPGTIDADYPGEWAVLLVNLSGVVQVITHGDRIGQAVIARHEVVEFEWGQVGVTTDRTGGYGSTGR